MHTELRWYRATRQTLPGLLVGLERPVGASFDSPEQALGSSVDFIVGYAIELRPATPAAANPPEVVLLDDGKVSELLSWLHTYSDESFPISQYCRIQTLREWSLVESHHSAQLPERTALWPVASLIVGEMLAQAESDLNLSTVPLSWANGCFSLAMARVIRMEGPAQDSLTRTAAERLHQCEANPRFARRPVGVYALAPLWSMLTKRELLRGSLEEVCLAIVHALDSSAADLLRNTDDLRSHSAEVRVRGFDTIADRAMLLAKMPGQQRVPSAALLAASALMVGGSTSHLELLRPAISDMPETLAWFGLMAGLAGPTAWDPAWLRLAKGIERQLADAALTDSGNVQGDLAWLEYEWLSALSDEDAYVGFPKQYQRLLTVEVLPNAHCQFRLQVQGKGKPSRVEPARFDSQPSSVRTPNVAAIDAVAVPAEEWNRIQNLTAELARLLHATSLGLPADAQKPLFENGVAKEPPKAPRSRAKGPAKR